MDEKYLWYGEIRDSAARANGTVQDYFDSLLVKSKDRFSFIRTLDDDEKTAAKRYGLRPSFGVHWVGASARIVAYVDKNSPAERAGLARGMRLVDVLSVSEGLNNWYLPSAGARVTFTVQDTPGASPREVTLVAETVAEQAVPLTRVLDANGRKVGYVLFNSHNIDGGQDELIDAIAQLAQQSVSEVVLDMRYNGGGYLYQALSLSSMLGGSRAQGKVFARRQFNSKRQEETQHSAVPFSSQLLYAPAGSRHATGSALPVLELPRVYVLSTGNTCSASEAVVNGLRGAGVQVELIGQTTCGKPYGFLERKNCGLGINAIEFVLTNHLGQGHYTQGFAPTCAVADDLQHALGDAQEGMLAAALRHMSGGTCPAKAAPEGGQALPAPGGIALSFERPQLPGMQLLPTEEDVLR